MSFESSSGAIIRVKPSIDGIEELHKSGSEISGDDERNGDGLGGLLQYNIDEEDEDEEEDDDEEENKNEDNERGGINDPYWRKMLRQEERLNDRYQLRKLHERANFLPNPRLFAARTAPL